VKGGGVRFEVRLAGAGGQGVILAGVILAEAAGLHDGKQVAQTQSYGPEARGGASRSEVILSDEPIRYPKSLQLDVLLALTQEACDRYFHDLRQGGTLIVDSDLVPTPPTSAAVSVPITRLVRNTFGRDVFANIAALGVLAAVTGVVSARALRAAIAARVPAGTRDVNRAALDLGLQAGREAVGAAQVSEEPIADG
jgi:2-oxoglutarate ferredoxin oxidoreductase subunit gamma